MSDEKRLTRRQLEARLAASERRVATLVAVLAAREAQLEDAQHRLRAYGLVVGQQEGRVRWLRECLND